MKLKLFLIGISAVFALSGCSTMSDTWGWFFEEDQVIEISEADEMDEEFIEEFDEEFEDEFADEFRRRI